MASFYWTAWYHNLEDSTHLVTYLNSTETVETGEPLSTDETTSLFDSTAVFASVLRGTF
jgi:hypothetical protein